MEIIGLLSIDEEEGRSRRGAGLLEDVVNRAGSWHVSENGASVLVHRFFLIKLPEVVEPTRQLI